MSESIDTYLQQVPEKCRKCPIFKIVCNSIKEDQKYTERYETVTSRMMDDVGPDNVEISPSASAMFIRYFAHEIKATNALAALVEKTRAEKECPGPVRDALIEDRLPWKIIAFLTLERTCTNQNFEELQGHEFLDPILRSGPWNPMPENG